MFAKLDMYDSTVEVQNHPLTNKEIVKINVIIDGSNDPVLVDIFSEIENSDNNIFVNGFMFKYLDKFEVHLEHSVKYLSLLVKPCDYREIKNRR